MEQEPEASHGRVSLKEALSVGSLRQRPDGPRRADKHRRVSREAQRFPANLLPNSSSVWMQAAGTRIGVFTDAPKELSELALAHAGATRRVDVVGTRAEVLAALGADAVVVGSRKQLASLR